MDGKTTMKKIVMLLLIAWVCVQCSQYLNQGKQDGLDQLQNTERQDSEAPVISGFESEPIVYEDDREGLGHIFSSSQPHTIIFRKYFQNWYEEARFRHPLKKDLLTNLPIFNIIVQDSDSRAEEIKLNFRVVRTSNPLWASVWKEAPLINVPYKAYHSKVMLSARTLGNPICRVGTHEYELQLQAVDGGGHSSNITNIPFRVENLKPPVLVEVDLGFQSQRKPTQKTFWDANLKNIFTPAKLSQTDEPLIIKRYKIFSPIDMDTYMRVYPEFDVFYKLESHYVDTTLLEPEPLLATVLSRNKLQSHIVISRLYGEEIRKLSEPLLLDEKTRKSYFEVKLKKGESIILDIDTAFQYEELPARHSFNYGRNNLAYHSLEIEPLLTIESLPYPNEEEYRMYRDVSDNWNFLQHRKKESIIYVQKTSI